MKRNSIIKDFLKKNSSPEIKETVRIRVALANEIHNILVRKGWTQKDLARKLKKTEAEVSKWLSGQHNLSSPSIAKIHIALGEKILLTPTEAKKEYGQPKYMKVEADIIPNQIAVRTNYESATMQILKSQQISTCVVNKSEVRDIYKKMNSPIAAVEEIGFGWFPSDNIFTGEHQADQTHKPRSIA